MGITVTIILIFFAVVILVYLALRAGSQKFFLSLDLIWKKLESGKGNMLFNDEMISELPDAVRRYFKYTIRTGAVIPESVRIEMKGSIDTGSGKWIDFEAEEILCSKGFVWKACFRMGSIPVRGGDYYFDNDGRVSFRMFGLIPVVDSKGPDIAKSSRGRVAGELFWLPSELLPIKGTSWRQIDASHIEATKSIDGEEYVLKFEIDQDGKPLSIELSRWGDVGGEEKFKWIPYGGEFVKLSEFEGFRIPSSIKAGWWAGTEKYDPVFKAEIVNIKYGKD